MHRWSSTSWAIFSGARLRCGRRPRGRWVRALRCARKRRRSPEFGSGRAATYARHVVTGVTGRGHPKRLTGNNSVRPGRCRLPARSCRDHLRDLLRSSHPGRRIRRRAWASWRDDRRFSWRLGHRAGGGGRGMSGYGRLRRRRGWHRAPRTSRQPEVGARRL